MCIFVAHTAYKIMICLSYISKYFMNYLKSLKTTSTISIAVISISSYPKQQLSQSSAKLRIYQNCSQKDIIKTNLSKKI